MTNPSPSPNPGHKRYFFDKFGLTERLLERCLGEALDCLLGWAGGDEGGGAGGVEQALGTEIVSVGVAGALAGENADAAAGAGSLAGRFDDLLVDAERGGGDGLEVKVGVVATGSKSLAQAALEEALRDAEFFEKITLVTGVCWSSGLSHYPFSLRLSGAPRDHVRLFGRELEVFAVSRRNDELEWKGAGRGAADCDLGTIGSDVGGLVGLFRGDEIESA